MDIDFVIIWVDGNDRKWQKERDFWLHQKDGQTEEAKSGQDSSGVYRFREWDTLKYWFRAVEKYAPWVRKIHFVTNGQLPSWLNLKAEKLHFVKHSDFIPEKYLPTFSSHPIELNLHRIPGLAEHFVYFNDDFFLNAPVGPELFFRDGLPCDFPEEKPNPFVRRNNQYNDIVMNSQVFMNMHFKRMDVIRQNRKKWYSMKAGRDAVRNRFLDVLLKHSGFFGFANYHLAQPYLKSTFEKVWECDPQWLDETCSHRFRDASDVSQLVCINMQYACGDFYPFSRRNAGKYYAIEGAIDELCDAIIHQKYPMICANDAVSDEGKFEMLQKRLTAAFDTVLPEASSYEL